jgi:ferredoxin-type protein NapF
MPASSNRPGVVHRRARTESIRPPWSLPEELFKSLCNGCGGCRDECPRGILQKGAGGLPFIDFALGACNMCGECVDACGRGALTQRYRGAEWGPWQIKASVGDDCLIGAGVMCRQCGEVCHPHAIRFIDGGRPSIDMQVCNGCGACYSSCPADAISLFDSTAL